jgi:predicted nucleic acid-binding protein
MIILDTNVISAIPQSAVHRRVQIWLDGQPRNLLCATAISLAEISFGIERLPPGRRRETLKADMEDVFAAYFQGRILPFDERAARTYGRIVAEARGRGQSILMADGQIAAIARVRSLAVATRDTTPFEAAGIAVINPWQL